MMSPYMRAKNAALEVEPREPEDLKKMGEINNGNEGI